LLVCSNPIIAQLDLQHLENLSGQLARAHFNTQKRMPPYGLGVTGLIPAIRAALPVPLDQF
jgi:hypothetical protein